MDAAASSIKRDGIACTSKLEQTLFDDMNGLCRELMAELLAAGAATAKDYLAKPGERNAGNHGKRIVTLFGELPEIKRTYYWDDDSRTGKFGELVRAEFDRRFGQVPETTLYITDGGKWLHKSNRLEEFFAHLVRDLRQVNCAA